MANNDDAVVESVELPADVVERAGQVGTGIVVLPRDQRDGKAVYTEPSVMLVKELRATGADAAYLDPSDVRAFEVKKGVLGDGLLAVVIGIASNGAWEAIKALLRRGPTQPLSVTYLELDDGNERRGLAWKVEGDPDAVLDAIDKLRRGEPEPPQVDDGRT
jgi:hypothetical protein